MRAESICGDYVILFFLSLKWMFLLSLKWRLNSWPLYHNDTHNFYLFIIQQSLTQNIKINVKPSH
jgi:hypothetical protein